ncbi:Carbohydrate esterase 4 protein [Apophysomyces ossiformis]|uniref:Carbohydrate esterase 4 protein n=1 Tax=Apophysomyces ossiformis TaxID=679940 RepID=A0A8H7EU57_9FUNG|nr:Carbohydrate esterase 4 protein [Apophysomyces ossiformis]
MRATLIFTLATALLSAVSAARVRQPTVPVVYQKCKQPGSVALTFDDGPFEYTWDLAKLLHEQGVKATFFMNGKNFADVASETTQTSDGEKTYLQVIKHVHDLGHQVASHTYTHKNLPGLSDRQVKAEMNKESNLIYKAIGKRPAYMRPPEGAYDSRSLAILGQLGYKGVVMWDIDTNDWRGLGLEAEMKEIAAVVDQETCGNADGHIILMHDVWEHTAKELAPWAIQYLRCKGFRFQTVAECLGTNDPYL